MESLLETRNGKQNSLDLICKGNQKANRGWSPRHLAELFGHIAVAGNSNVTGNEVLYMLYDLETVTLLQEAVTLLEMMYYTSYVIFAGNTNVTGNDVLYMLYDLEAVTLLHEAVPLLEMMYYTCCMILAGSSNFTDNDVLYKLEAVTLLEMM
ncbi:unnamed protein product [Mytilus coruscus]|uniref:Uncharacterized protein n=1 Tax=Mytilus coruscus TaxID=42192 RepID=A0A6J8EQW0_MYTCO|nr:unnamed protein product [Mytilus coruscus]